MAGAEVVESALQSCLDLICELAGWPVGHAVLLRHDGVSFDRLDLWHDSDPRAHRRFVVATEEFDTHPRSGWREVVLESAEAVWVPDLRAEPSFLRLEAAEAAGLVSAMALPIVGPDGLEGVLEFFAHEARSREELQHRLVSTVGRHAGDLIAGARAMEALIDSELQLLQAQSLAGIGSWSWEVGSDTVSWSPQMHQILGLPEDGAAVSFESYVAMVHPDDQAEVHDSVRAALEQGTPFARDYRVVRPDGEVRVLHSRGRVLAERDGEVLSLGGYCQDVTWQRDLEERRHSAQQELGEHRELLERIARGESQESVTVAVCRAVERRYPESWCTVLLVDASGAALQPFVGPSFPPAAARALVGLPMAEGAGACGTATARREVVVVEDALTDPLLQDWRGLLREHGLGSVWSQPLLSSSGSVLGAFAVYRKRPHAPDEAEVRTVTDLSQLAALAVERGIAEAALTRAAQVDGLTSLPNRAVFLDTLAETLERPAPVAVLFFDLDGFKWINDSLGHPVGDRVLVEVSRRLESVVEPGGLIARFGGDEFTLMVTDADPARVAAAADAVEAAFDRPFLVDGVEHYFTVSIGIAFNDVPVTAYELVRDADTAMYAAKAQGRDRRVHFDGGMRAHAIARLALERDLRRALERDEIVVHYQPVFDLETGQVVGSEALARWRHPTRGLIPPVEFIPMAEEDGLIVPLGHVMLDKVARDVARWQQQGFTLRTAVNVSVVQLADPGLVEFIQGCFGKHHVLASSFALEVTETAFMEKFEVARTTLTALLELGADIVIDDFGVGYSSVARLGSLPVTGLKIDRAFTAALGSSPAADGVFAAITTLAEAFSLDVVVEGIETEAERDLVLARGCRRGQGYLLGRPMPADELEALLGLGRQE